ncbi:PH domain-containing protein [Actinoplanes utahensis]|uniref:PH domain-containing protein n=1 Tax=Actinoplanes utahensis TaxID=1869 RepID=UPI0005B808C0|nr:PH domain-containing protein [Actinoplanes utahensis]
MALYSRYNSAVHTVFAVVFGAGALASAVAAFVPDRATLAPRLAIAVLAALACAAFLRMSRLRVVLHDDHVELVNPLRTHRIRWADISAVEAFVRSGWRVRVWTGSRARLAFGLSQYSRYTPARLDDDVDQHAPGWLRDGYHELVACWRRHQSSGAPGR